MKFLGVALAITFAVLTTSLASAQTEVLDTGTPTGTLSPVEMLSNYQYAVEFQLNAGQTITSVSNYFGIGDATTGTSYLYYLYSGALSRNSTAIDTTSVIWNGTLGWDPTTVSWTAPTTGDYWLAIQGTSTSYLTLPTLPTPTSGTIPALGFQDKSGSNWVSGPAFGTVIVATPEPSAWALGLICLGAFAVLRFRRQQA